MSRRSSASVQRWFVAVLFGLGALLPAAAAQRPSATEPHLLREAGPAFAWSAALPARESVLPGNARHASHALPRTSTPAPLLPVSWFVAPAFATNIPASGGAKVVTPDPRTTGPSRAPPAAA